MKRNIALSAILGMCFLTGKLVAAEDPTPAGKNVQNSPTVATLQDLACQLLKNLPSDFRLDPTRMEKLGEYYLPTLRNGDWILSDYPLPLVDSFSQRTSAVATFFVKSGSEFIRESTSLITDKNSDALGTILRHTNPAYDALMNEKRFTGEVDLFGVKYMADYDVIRNKEGTVIGAYFIGIPLK